MMEGFFGYLLPWDQTAYWATVVGVNLQATGPFVGPFLGDILRGGSEIGPETLARFYSLHMLVLPGAIGGLIALAPLPRRAPRRDLAAVVADGRGPTAAGAAASAAQGARLAGLQRSAQAMNRRLEQRRADHKQYKKDVQERGKPFFPFSMFHDTVMSLLVVVVIVALTVIWKLTTPHEDELLGLARQALRREGRPRDDELRPAAGLVLLLPLLPAADLQVAGLRGPRHGHRPDDPDDAPARAAVPGRAAASGGRCAGRWRWWRRS